MNILLVQPYQDLNFSQEDLFTEIHELIQHQTVDLIVFPEGFMYLEIEEKRFQKVEELSILFSKPVIVGFSTEFGSEEAIYANTQAIDDETNRGMYIKHSTAGSVLFDFDCKDNDTDFIYEPIILQDKKIQMYICHDMFYPLITERLEREGMDLLINLTGGNVNMSKWCNLLKGRSIEADIPVLCTMNNRANEKQPSDRIAYSSGNRLKPLYVKGEGEKEHAFSIFSIEEEEKINEPPLYYSDKHYKQFTVSLNNATDIAIDLEDQGITHNLDVVNGYEYSLRLQKEHDYIHVHLADIDSLYKRLFVFNEPRHLGDHEVFIYLAENEVDEEEVISLMKLRAIENRIAIIVAAPNIFIGAKTNRYKNIQLFDGQDGEIGFDLAHMLGVESIYQKDIKKYDGLNLYYKTQYEELVKSKEFSELDFSNIEITDEIF